MPEILSKQVLQMRLLAVIPRRGDPRTLTSEIRLQDIEKWLHVSVKVLAQCAHRRREVDDALQVQLSSFFGLVDHGLLVKAKEGPVYVLRRVRAPPGKSDPPRATIDLSGLSPRVNWRP